MAGLRSEKHPLGWVAECLLDEPDYIEKPMFGCLACYLRGRLVLVLAARKPPWDGLLVPVARPEHSSIMAEFPALAPHPILGKWLYISQVHEDFEETAHAVAQRVQEGDHRFGVEPSGRLGRKK